MAFTTTIEGEYLDMKLEDLAEKGYFIEYKEVKPFWRKRFLRLRMGHDFVYLVGQRSHRFRVLGKEVIDRLFVPDRYRNAVSTDKIYAIKCGEKEQ